MTTVRNPAVAGRFYPDNAKSLRQTIVRYLEAAGEAGPTPKAMIAPHAGYPYSGPIAASVYAHLRNEQTRRTISKVVLLGPSHYAFVYGLALSSAAAFATPLGQVPIDKKAVAELLTLRQAQLLDEAHAREHSLEVQLPFLQITLGNFSLIPIAVGEATAAQVEEVLALVWGGSETLIVVSSDLSHFHDYDTAKKLDQATSQAIERLQPDDIGREQACGRIAIQGLLRLARKLGLSATTVDLRNSGDTAGSKDRVVGYGGYIFRL